MHCWLRLRKHQWNRCECARCGAERHSWQSHEKVLEEYERAVPGFGHGIGVPTEGARTMLVTQTCSRCGKSPPPTKRVVAFSR
jgi:hypothetical protein